MLKVKDSAGNVGLGPEQEAALLDHPWLSWLPTSARHEAEASSYLLRAGLAWPHPAESKGLGGRDGYSSCALGYF